MCRGATKVALLLYSLFAVEFTAPVAFARIAAEKLDAAEFQRRHLLQGTGTYERYTGRVWAALRIASAAKHEKAAKCQGEQCLHRGRIAASPRFAQSLIGDWGWVFENAFT